MTDANAEDPLAQFRTPEITEGLEFAPANDPRRGVLDRFRERAQIEGFEDVAAQSEPLTGWVVHEVVSPRDAEPLIWAWCRTRADQPGYDEITFTKPDGTTAVDPGKREVKLGAVITKLWC